MLDVNVFCSLTVIRQMREQEIPFIHPDISGYYIIFRKMPVSYVSGTFAGSDQNKLLSGSVSTVASQHEGSWLESQLGSFYVEFACLHEWVLSGCLF